MAILSTNSVRASNSSSAFLLHIGGKHACMQVLLPVLLIWVVSSVDFCFVENLYYVGFLVEKNLILSPT